MHQFKEHIARAWTLAWDEGEVDALDRIYHEEYRRESAASGRTMSLAELKQDIRDIRDAFPDLSNTLDDLVIDGGRGALFWNSVGTFRRNFGGVPATGCRVSTRGSNQLVLRDGLIVREKVTWDRAALLADVGVPSLRAAFEDDPAGTVADDLSGAIDIESIKGFNRQFVTGVTVVTTVDKHGAPGGSRSTRTPPSRSIPRWSSSACRRPHRRTARSSHPLIWASTS
ncbi:ester cyclase [Leucobacter soli]|uniref:ester cyclase n=1 Tax=Leucobacter soli TaxID=2812850 RepID=UPI00362185A8